MSTQSIDQKIEAAIKKLREELASNPPDIAKLVAEHNKNNPVQVFNPEAQKPGRVLVALEDMKREEASAIGLEQQWEEAQQFKDDPSDEADDVVLDKLNEIVERQDIKASGGGERKRKRRRHPANMDSPPSLRP